MLTEYGLFAVCFSGLQTNSHKIIFPALPHNYFSSAAFSDLSRGTLQWCGLCRYPCSRPVFLSALDPSRWDYFGERITSSSRAGYATTTENRWPATSTNLCDHNVDGHHYWRVRRPRTRCCKSIGIKRRKCGHSRTECPKARGSYEIHISTSFLRLLTPRTSD